VQIPEELDVAAKVVDRHERPAWAGQFWQNTVVMTNSITGTESPTNSVQQIGAWDEDFAILLVWVLFEHHVDMLGKCFR